MNKYLYFLDKMFLVLLLSFYTISFGQEKISVDDITEDNSIVEYVKNGDLKELKNYLESNPNVDIDKEYSGAWTLLMYASGSGHLNIVKYLREVKSASVNYSTLFYNHTALMAASENGHIKIVKYLVAQGVNLDEWNKKGDTALMMAIEGGHIKVVKYLVKKGVDINIKGTWGGTVLMLASFKGNLEVVKYLVENGIDVNVVDEIDNGSTSLQYAKENGHLEVVKYLIENGADFNTEDEQGDIQLSASFS